MAPPRKKLPRGSLDDELKARTPEPDTGHQITEPPQVPNEVPTRLSNELPDRLSNGLPTQVATLVATQGDSPTKIDDQILYQIIQEVVASPTQQGNIKLSPEHLVALRIMNIEDGDPNKSIGKTAREALEELLELNYEGIIRQAKEIIESMRNAHKPVRSKINRR